MKQDLEKNGKSFKFYDGCVEFAISPCISYEHAGLTISQARRLPRVANSRGGRVDGDGQILHFLALLQRNINKRLLCIVWISHELHKNWSDIVEIRYKVLVQFVDVMKC